MKFTCEKEQLYTALTVTSRNVSPKNAILALEGILVEANDSLVLTGYNLETGVVVKVDAQIQETGKLVLSARLILDIIRKMPNQEITFSSQEYWVTITCGQIVFQIMGMDPEHYPDLPDVNNQQGFVISQDLLKTMISTTLFAVSTNEARPIHTGSLFEIQGDTLTIVSVDGYRLALRREKYETSYGGTDFSFVVPGKALSEVEKMCEIEETLSVFFSAKHVMFQMGDKTLITRRLEGEFLAYRSAIPQNNEKIIFAERRDLTSAIDRVSLIINDKVKAPIRCYFSKEELEISSKTAIGEAMDRCPITGCDEELEIGFNYRYLQEALKSAPADRVRIEFSKAVDPCLILPEEEGDQSFCYMVLPVRLK